MRLALALVLVLALALPTAAAAASAKRPGGTLKEKKEALGEMRRQLEAARARASAARSREASLLAELEQMERTLARKRSELGRLDIRIVRLEAELRQLEGRRGQVAEDIVVHRGALGARLQALEAVRHTPAGPGWLGEADRLARRRLEGALARVAQVDLGRLGEFAESAERLEARQATVARGRQELVALRGAVETERTAMNEEAGRRRALLAQVRDDRATHERMVGELAEASRRLEALVQELSRRAAARPPARLAAVRPGEPEASRPPAVGLGTLRGQLPWPAAGRVVATFGRQVHPRFGTETFRHGVDIEAAEGAAIRAVYAGTVIYRGWLRGYGNLIILDHGAGYWSGRASG
jgi:septal ring factor EnvC (AmiA/AmiB activator)